MSKIKRRIQIGLAFSVQIPIFLESKFRSKLSHARSADRVCNHTEINRILQIAVRIGKVDRVEQIENIEAEFKAHPFIDFRVLHKTDVKAFLQRSAESVASEIAETAERRREAG